MWLFVCQAHIMCVCCGRGNPADLSHCLTCDTRLHAVKRAHARTHSHIHPHTHALYACALFVAALQTALEVESAPCVQEDSHKANLSCSACGRVNRGDARFCDWCGTKKTVGCVFRGASVAPRAASCDVCGRSPEAAPGSRADATVSTSRVGERTLLRVSTRRPPGERVCVCARPQAGPPTAERHAQTLGTHWPSGTGRPRAPRAAVSPGRGQTEGPPAPLPPRAFQTSSGARSTPSVLRMASRVTMSCGGVGRGADVSVRLLEEATGSRVRSPEEFCPQRRPLQDSVGRASPRPGTTRRRSAACAVTSRLLLPSLR